MTGRKCPITQTSKARCEAGDFHLVHGEADFRIKLDIEEVSAAKMRVSLRFSRPDRFGIDANLNPGRTRVPGIKCQLPLDVFEIATDASDHHVPRAELGSGVPGLEKLLGHF